MNGYWFPWDDRRNGNRRAITSRPGSDVHDIFASVGATNVTWVWCPYVDPSSKQNQRRSIPGDDYVDWTCLDGYNWGPGPANPIRGGLQAPLRHL